MVNSGCQTKKTFVLDTNVLLNDPHCITSLGDNDVIIPMIVLEEIDGFKKGHSSLASSAREVSRFLDGLREHGRLFEGVEHPGGGILKVPQLNPKVEFTNSSSKENNDNIILQCCIYWNEEYDNLVLITEDINMRIRGDAVGIVTEAHEAVRVEDVSFYDEVKTVNTKSSVVDELYRMGAISQGELWEYDGTAPIKVNEYCVIKSPNGTALAQGWVRESLRQVNTSDEMVYGIKPRNKEQAFALDALLDEDIKLVVLLGKAGCGKAQPLDADILTPSGYVKMGDICVGDKVSTPDGGHALVTGVFPQGVKDIYRVHFTDGTFTECCDEHLWETATSLDRDNGRRGSVKTLNEIRHSLRYGSNNKRNHSIPITDPITMRESDVEIPPYLMGALLGDGSFSVGHPALSNSDEEVLNRCQADLSLMGLKLSYSSGVTYRITMSDDCDKSMKTCLKNLGLYGCKSNDKFIPDAYKFGSVEQRTAILQGLMDTDGTCSKNGHVSITTTSEQLSEDIKWLVQSLGGTCKVKSRATKYPYDGEIKDGQESYRCNITLPNQIEPFSLARKKERVPKRVKYFPRRYIDSVEHIGQKEAQCISISSEDSLYLTNDCIVTHNTLLALAAGLSQVLELDIYEKMMVTRPVVPMGNDIGFLPGDLKEKLDPWMAPIYDNISFLYRGEKKKKGKARGPIKNGFPTDQSRRFVEDLLDMGKLSMDALTYIRGRSISDQFILIDEGQNLTAHEVKTIITRCGQGSKIVVTGDPFQIDNPYLDTHNNGLAYLIDRLSGEEIFASVVLIDGERSELAELAAKKL